MIDGTGGGSKKPKKPTASELKGELKRRLARVVGKLKVAQVRDLLEMDNEELVDLLAQRPSSISHLASPAVAAQNRDLMR